VQSVLKEHKALTKKSKTSPARHSSSYRSEGSTARSLSLHVAARESKALESFDKILNMAAENVLHSEQKAAALEAAHQAKQDRIETRLREERGQLRDQALCKDAWRKNKYDTAQRIAGLQLEHQAQKVVVKEHARLRALKEREARFNDKSALQRQRHAQRARSVATTLSEQRAARGELEAMRESREVERSVAYSSSVKRHREGLCMRGKQKDMEVNHKRDRVRRMEEEKVRRLMDKSEEKMQHFLHNQLEKQRQEQEMLHLRQSEATKKA